MSRESSDHVRGFRGSNGISNLFRQVASLFNPNERRQQEETKNLQQEDASTNEIIPEVSCSTFTTVVTANTSPEIALAVEGVNNRSSGAPEENHTNLSLSAAAANNLATQSLNLLNIQQNSADSSILLAPSNFIEPSPRRILLSNEASQSSLSAVSSSVRDTALPWSNIPAINAIDPILLPEVAPIISLLQPNRNQVRHQHQQESFHQTQQNSQNLPTHLQQPRLRRRNAVDFSAAIDIMGPPIEIQNENIPGNVMQNSRRGILRTASSFGGNSRGSGLIVMRNLGGNISEDSDFENEGDSSSHDNGLTVNGLNYDLNEATPYSRSLEAQNSSGIAIIQQTSLPATQETSSNFREVVARLSNITAAMMNPAISATIPPVMSSSNENVSARAPPQMERTVIGGPRRRLLPEQHPVLNNFDSFDGWLIFHGEMALQPEVSDLISRGNEAQASRDATADRQHNRIVSRTQRHGGIHRIQEIHQSFENFPVNTIPNTAVVLSGAPDPQTLLQVEQFWNRVTARRRNMQQQNVPQVTAPSQPPPPRPQLVAASLRQNSEPMDATATLFESFINGYLDAEKCEERDQSSQTNRNKNESNSSAQKPHPTSLPSTVITGYTPLHCNSLPLKTPHPTVPFQAVSRTIWIKGNSHVLFDPLLSNAHNASAVEGWFSRTYRDLCDCEHRHAESQALVIRTTGTGLSRLLDANACPVMPADWSHVDIMMKVLCGGGEGVGGNGDGHLNGGASGAVGIGAFDRSDGGREEVSAAVANGTRRRSENVGEVSSRSIDSGGGNAGGSGRNQRRRLLNERTRGSAAELESFYGIPEDDWGFVW
ncbi:hypothetical protein HK100_001887 [Physocladia obscura]|uniref:Uncharacterized protein n=1 Tax=Physocladia obscura TaxID=109957 RepID=A0AAD5XFU6_9FUNG|nr:hypothetical protein HK100_001887 [Physocladia obscura]